VVVLGTTPRSRKKRANVSAPSKGGDFPFAKTHLKLSAFVFEQRIPNLNKSAFRPAPIARQTFESSTKAFCGIGL
jgi:hypothetical protein